MHSQSEICNNFNRYPWPRFYITIFLNLLSPYITSCHTFFSLTTIMGFIRIWENCSWIWFCEGFLCQFLAKKGEKGYCYYLTLPSLQQLLKILITKTCHKFSRNSNGVNFFVTCDLSYEHSCDLCSELQGRYSGHSLKVLWCLWKDSLSPTVLFFHHQWQEMVRGLKGNEVHPLPPVLQEVLDG